MTEVGWKKEVISGGGAPGEADCVTQRSRSNSREKSIDKRQNSTSSTSTTSSSTTSSSSDVANGNPATTVPVPSGEISEKRQRKIAKKLAKKEAKKLKKERKRHEKLERKNSRRILKEQKKLEKERRKVEKRASKLSNTNNVNEVSCGPPIELMDSKAKAPETKEEWEARQSQIRRVADPVTGRVRLVKGDGEILEEIVSHDRHREINKQATSSDGEFFQSESTKIGWNHNNN